MGPASFRVADDMRSFWDRVERGAWEAETLAALAARVRPGMLIVDVGAWVGPISLLCAALGARVVALEPDPAAAENLRANRAANPDFASRLEILPMALAPQAGQLCLGSPRKLGDSMGSVLLAGRSEAQWEADALTPASLAVRLGGGPDILKIDVEGAEYGLADHLAALVPGRLAALIMAFHPRLLAGAGYGAQAIDGLTRRLETLLAGLAPRPLDGPPAEVGIISRERNSTMLFEPRQASQPPAG